MVLSSHDLLACYEPRCYAGAALSWKVHDRIGTGDRCTRCTALRTTRRPSLMSHRLFEALGGQILADLARNNLMRAVPSIHGPKGKQDGLPKSAPPNTGEDMDALLRGILRYITPTELAQLLQ